MGTPKKCFWWSQNDNESLLWVRRRNAPMITKNTSVRSISPPEKLFCLSNLPTRRAIMLNYRPTQTAQNQGFWLHKKNHWKWTFLGKYKGDLKSNIFWNRFLLAMTDRSVSAGIPTWCVTIDVATGLSVVSVSGVPRSFVDESSVHRDVTVRS